MADFENEAKLYLESVLKDEKLKNLNIEILGNSEKGDGYLGDIVFLDASEITEDGSTKKYNLVLKCSKKSQILRDKSPMKEMFANEINFYEEILPVFVQFEKDRGIKNPFDSVAKYYGSDTDDTKEILVLENLKKRDYNLWDRKKPLTRKHIDLVVSKYAQLHAISIAMADQQPGKFQVIVKKLQWKLSKLGKKQDLKVTVTLLEKCLEEVANILKDEVDENTILKWLNFKHQIKFIFEVLSQSGRVKAVLHGDCWNNNFMYQCEDDNENSPKSVAIVDWQLCKYASPISDLSYFLFTCISEEDLDDLDTILTHYYNSLAHHINNLGSQPDSLYPFDEFMNDWKTHCKYGILMSSLIHKICSTKKDEVVDIAQSAEQGKRFGSSLMNSVADTDTFKIRTRPIVEYVVKHDLL